MGNDMDEEGFVVVVEELMVVVGFTKGREERLCGVAEGGGA